MPYVSRTYAAGACGIARPNRSKSAASRSRIADGALDLGALFGWQSRSPWIVTRVGRQRAVRRRGPQHSADVAFHWRNERRLGEPVARRGSGVEGRPVTVGERAEQPRLETRQRGAHPDEGRARAQHQGVAEEAVLAGDEHLVG